MNLSSRLEGLNKDYGTHILVNETTYLAAKDSGFVFRELDLIRVKGKLQPVTIYELVGSGAICLCGHCKLASTVFAKRALFISNAAGSMPKTLFNRFSINGPMTARPAPTGNAVRNISSTNRPPTGTAFSL